MKTTVCAVVLVLLVIAPVAYAAEAGDADPDAWRGAWAAQQQELDELRARLSALEAAAAPAAALDPDACCAGCSAGLVGGAELTLLRPHHAMGIRGADDTPLEFGFEPAPRFWLGYIAPSGGGFRVRYWDFDHTAADVSAFSADYTAALRFDVGVLDAELTDLIPLGERWEILLSGGYRYVDYQELAVRTDSLTGEIDELHEYDSASHGATAAVELRRYLLAGLSLFGNVRASWLFGDRSEYQDFPRVLLARENDNSRMMLETQWGCDWTRPTRWGAVLFARTAGELQWWDNFSGEPTFDGGQSIGFAGLTLAAGVTR